MNVYQNGFLHRDISIGNVLALEEPEERKPFEWNTDFVASLGEATTEMLQAKLRDANIIVPFDVRIPDAKALVKELDTLLIKFGISATCEAFIIDCDLAKDWRKLFGSWRKEKALYHSERVASGPNVVHASNS